MISKMVLMALLGFGILSSLIVAPVSYAQESNTNTPEATTDTTEAPESDEQSEQDPLSLSCQLGATLVSGNARSGAVASGCDAAKEFGDFKFSVLGRTNWGRAKFGGRGQDATGANIPEGKWIVNQRDARLKLREDYFLSDDERSYIFGVQGIATNEFAGYRLRLNVEAGGGHTYIKTDIQEHGIEVGIHYVRELGVFKDENRVGMVATLLGETLFSETAKLEYLLSWLPSFKNSADWRLEGFGGLSFKITDRLSFKSGLTLLYDNDPSLIAPRDPFGIESVGANPIPAKNTDLTWSNVLVIAIF